MSNRGKLLLIDDEPSMFDTLVVLLGDEFEVIYAESGEVGLAVAADIRPDIILLDVGMPGISGFEVCVQLKNDVNLRHVPIIFLTAYGSVDDEMEGLRAGAVDYISKPFNPLIVKARVSAQYALKQQHDELRTLVRRDDLTQISNRRHFEEVMRVEWRRSYRYQSPLSLMIIDVDAFKNFNDVYGHVAGDDCLKEVAQRLDKTVCRSGDLMARLGGEEFVALLPNTPEESLPIIGDRIRTVVEDAQIPHKSSAIKDVVTVSIGGASIVPSSDSDIKSLFERADKAMYEAKRRGGNKVFVDTSNAADQAVA